MLSLSGKTFSLSVTKSTNFFLHVTQLTKQPTLRRLGHVPVGIATMNVTEPAVGDTVPCRMASVRPCLVQTQQRH